MFRQLRNFLVLTAKGDLGMLQTRKKLVVCRICRRKIHRPLFSVNDLYFCREHVQEFKRRQHEGVSATELNPLWGDSLENWRECPPELDKERKFQFLTTPFMFRQIDESWLIFERAYCQITLPRRSKKSSTIYNPRKDVWHNFRGQKAYPIKHRSSDYIVIDKQTGKIRRFVDVALNQVIDDLRGIQPAPAQAELAKFWGKRKSSGIRERRMFENSRQRFRDEQG
jgi:hypothetical protein